MKPVTRNTLTIVLGVMFLYGCATTEKMDQPTYERLHAQAKKSIERSDSVRYTWTNSVDAMEKADAAAKSGDWATAIKEVKLAREYSELAYEQYKNQKEAVPVLD